MVSDTKEIQSVITRFLEEMASELQLDYDKAIDSGTWLIADLGLASVDFVHLIVEVEGHFKSKMGFHDLLMPNGKYVDDLTVGQFVAFIESRLSGVSETPENIPDLPLMRMPKAPTLGPDDLSAFRSLMPSLEKWGGYAAAPAKRNARIAFVLSSPRSGSTLLRAILAGHPELFAPPELHLLYYATMAQRHRALANEQNQHLLTGTIRAVMQLRACGAEEAADLLRSCEERQMPTHEFYALLQDQLGRRLLVDKTPTYAMSPEILRRAEQNFEEPLFIHLVRHPCGMIRSFEDGKLDQLTPFMRESHFTRRQLAELTWLVTNENIASFLATLPQERYLRIGYENLVHEPEPLLRRICDFLGVPFASDMLDPYKDLDSHMTTGVRSVSEFSGDLKFHLHSRIEPEAADRWRKYDSADSLSVMSRNLAASFGYRFEH
jgi:LPS sulfotransferase NodH/acyl carrier protein